LFGARVTKDRVGFEAEGPLRKHRDPVNYPQLEASIWTRYASGEANGDSAERFYSERLESHA